jgi:hypothetical protein
VVKSAASRRSRDDDHDDADNEVGAGGLADARLALRSDSYVLEVDDDMF